MVLQPVVWGVAVTPIARLAKAVELVVAFDALLTTLPVRNASGWSLVAAGLEEQPDSFWLDLAARAGVLPPSDPTEVALGVSRATRALVVAVYRGRANRADLRGAA